MEIPCASVSRDAQKKAADTTNLLKKKNVLQEYFHYSWRRGERITALELWVEIPPGRVCGSHSRLQCALSWGRGSTGSGVRRPSLATVTQLTAWHWRSPFPSLGLFLHLQNKDFEREAPGNFHSSQYSSSCVELTSARAVILKGWGNCINEKIRLGNVVGSGEVYGKQEFSCTAKGNNLCLTTHLTMWKWDPELIFKRPVPSVLHMKISQFVGFWAVKHVSTWATSLKPLLLRKYKETFSLFCLKSSPFWVETQQPINTTLWVKYQTQRRSIWGFKSTQGEAVQ